MKKKFDNTDNILGGIVKKVRQEKGLSQEALGKYVGLGKSSISKIESGKTNISIDDASVLLEAMGEKLSVYIDSQYPSAETMMKATIFVTVAACWFAEDKKITKQKAFNFLQKNQGIKFLEENWEIEQTLSREQIIEDLTRICTNHIAKAKKKERRVIMNLLKIENMGNKYNYENVLGEIACYIAKECNLTPSEAVGVVMNDDCTDAVIEEIQKSDRIDIEALASRYLTEELC